MNQRLLTILLCAFVAAAGASYLVYRLVGKELNGRAKGKTVTVVVASHDIEIGAILKKEDLKTGSMIGDLPKGIELKPETIIGRGVVSKLYEGEPIVEDRLAAAGSGGGLAATIPPGMRACAVKVNEVVGLAGFVVPGMRVDVLISGNSAGFNNAGVKVKTLLQNIQVLSAGTNFQRDTEGKPVQVQVVNLLVNPAQAELLSLASNETKIQLVLRNPLDTKMAKPPGSEVAALFGDAPAPHPVVRPVVAHARVEKPTPVKPQVYTVLVMNGSKESQQTFSSAGAHQ